VISEREFDMTNMEDSRQVLTESAKASDERTVAEPGSSQKEREARRSKKAALVARLAQQDSLFKMDEL